MLHGGVTEFTTIPPTVSPHYLLKLKRQTAHFEVSRHSISLLNRRMSLCVRLVSSIFRRSVQNVRLVRKFL